jgi:hypothetical protein
MAIDNRHNFHAFSALCGSDFRAAILGHNEGRIDEAFKGAFVAKLIGDIRQHSTQNLVSAPRPKAPSSNAMQWTWPIRDRPASE